MFIFTQLLDAAHQLVRFVTGECFGEIGTHPFTDMLGFSNIEQLAGNVVVFVDARLRGKRWRDMLEFSARHDRI